MLDSHRHSEEQYVARSLCSCPVPDSRVDAIREQQLKRAKLLVSSTLLKFIFVKQFGIQCCKNTATMLHKRSRTGGGNGLLTHYYP